MIRIGITKENIEIGDVRSPFNPRQSKKINSDINFNVEVQSSNLRCFEDNEFELTYNINANSKLFFDELSLNLPSDFSEENYKEIYDFFKEIKDKPYSLNLVEKILDKIETITINEQYESIKATLKEDIISNKINLSFNIEETEKVLALHK